VPLNLVQRLLPCLNDVDVVIVAGIGVEADEFRHSSAGLPISARARRQERHLRLGRPSLLPDRRIATAEDGALPLSWRGSARFTARIRSSSDAPGA
jgi:hypothetical protein